MPGTAALWPTRFLCDAQYGRRYGLRVSYAIPSTCIVTVVCSGVAPILKSPTAVPGWRTTRLTTGTESGTTDTRLRIAPSAVSVLLSA
eukprot:2818443-Rhodomonas_salina.1